MRSAIIYLFSLALLASQVSAHGIVTQITIAGKAYDAPPTGETGRKPPSILRQVPNNGPVGLSTRAMACGNSAPAALVADANPGDKVVFKWSSWPHQLGPIINYMASCGNTPCNEFDASQAQWFKVDQQGVKEDGTWVQLEVSQGQPTSMTIPTNLAPGGYLLRHEIIALHNAGSANGAEYYPSCTQLNIGGNKSGRPASSDLVTFPGAYNPESPSVKGQFNSYEMRTKGYVFPGPALASNVGVASPREGATGSTGSNTPPPPASKAPKSKCRVRKSQNAFRRRSTVGDNLRSHRRALGRLFSSHSR